MKKRTLQIGFRQTALALSIVFTSIGASAQTNVFDDIIVPSPNHTYLEAALLQEGLEGALQNNLANLTVFAPTDQAFIDIATALNTDIAGLLALPNLTDILTYHVLESTVPSSGVTNGAIVQPMSLTNTLKLTVTSMGDIYVNQAPVSDVAFDLTADNGLVHVLDAVVLPNQTVADIAIGSAVHTSLVTAVIQEELLPVLTDPLATLTVFAPTNQAFTDIATALNTDIAGLLALTNLKDILAYHVLGSTVPSSAVTNGLIAQPLSTTNTLKFTVTSMGDVYANQAPVSDFDLTAENGVVHILDAVVLPNQTVADIAIGSAVHTSLVTAVIQEELLPVLTDPLATLTVFAPTNQAFTDIATALNTDIAGLLALTNLKDILAYHVLGSTVPASAVTNGLIAQPLSTTNTLKLTVTSMGDVYVNQAPVSDFDLTAENGVVHILDAVVLPSQTVTDIAIGSAVHTSLVAAVIKAELLPALTNPLASLTVFAPTNQAFDALATALGTDLNGVLANPELADILLYHVVNGTVLSTDLANGLVPTLNGQSVLVDLTTGVMINQSNVTAADNAADNGVVHIIDAVLVPSLAGIEESQIEILSVYPNPASNVLNINNSLKGNYELVSIYGEVVKSGILSNNAIDVSELSTGNYFIKLTNNTTVYQAKFIKL